MIDSGFFREITDQYGRAPLHLAAVGPNLHEVEALLNYDGLNLDVNQQDSKGRSPLHFAAMYRSIPIAKALLDKGANVKQPDKSGKIPLDYTSDYDLAKILHAAQPGAHSGFIVDAYLRVRSFV